MIDSKELRIGNYVFNPYDEYTNVDVTILDYIVKCNYTQQKVTRYKPIPLTEQWLVDFGFEILDYLGDGTYKNETIYIEYHNYRKMSEADNKKLKNLYGVWFGDEDNGKWISDVKYVHQLQNLYFALTNEELKLNK